MQQGSDIIYKGKRIDKAQFRAWIYGANGLRKLVNHWDDFEAHMSTGIWFQSLDKVPTKQPRKTRTPKEFTDEDRIAIVANMEVAKLEDALQSVGV